MKTQLNASCNKGTLQEETVFIRKGHSDREELFPSKTVEEQGVEGLDRVVLTMRKGEVALLSIVHEYALGSTVHDSIVHYEVELASFEKEKVVLSLGHALSFITVGDRHRHTGSTNFHMLRSRSHSICTLMTRSSVCGDEYDGVIFSQLHLIDLAGSKSSTAETTGLGRKGDSYLNKNLLMLDRGIIPGYLVDAPVHRCHSAGREDKFGDFRDNFLLREQGNKRKFSSTVVDLSGDWSQARSSGKWNDQLPPAGSTVSKPNQTSKLIGGATPEINDMVQQTIHALEQQQSSPTGVKTPLPIGQPTGRRVPEEHIEDSKTKAESQEVENDKLKLRYVQFLEKISGLHGRDQKLSEEAPYANVLASTAVVEIKNLTGGSSIHFTGEVTN
ncbi:hypothetical protein Nepgr_002050 [Nepenthes gracilis]|uniref:Kinesin motor domain-containing protein n=1 Tax=Nepenthes gracilis TaxID=150966 RepID=A0AAD3P667_NEPGR|nr:hypothetical protein Nepgr_002050 [Nepenthes gracilis]